MPTHDRPTLDSPRPPDLTFSNVACPAPVSAPPAADGDDPQRHEMSQDRLVAEVGVLRLAVGDNTAAGMSLMQHESLYAAAGELDEKVHGDVADDVRPRDGVVARDAHRGTVQDDPAAKRTRSSPTDGYAADSDLDIDMDVDETPSDRHAPTVGAAIASAQSATAADTHPADRAVVDEASPAQASDHSRSHSHRVDGVRARPPDAGIAPVDQQLDWSGHLRAWDFSHRRLRSQYPSATLQPYSKFQGTQQSDRQVYNVEVTILTVDMEQSTLSGYLEICGLTPDHPTLTTFFTGEIIGGPEQKYSFRTRESAWGASDKTDLAHWARFAAWKPLSGHAKRNINFVYPLNHENWWQQEHIFMRWKEHFLVPDYKLKSIQGASFEGFYYICFNQVEGRVSGIYFHSKSEKYQQLELKHEGKQGVWGMGVCPSIEFR